MANAPSPPERGVARRDLVLALAAGLVVPFAFAPYDLWPVAMLAMTALNLLLAGRTPRQAFRLGWCFGFGMFGHGVWWIQVSVHQFGLPYYSFSVTMTALLVAFLSLYPALFAALLRRLPVGAEGLRHVLLAPALWVCGEWLRGWIFTGFPWLSLGYSQLDAPLSALAPWGGEHLCSVAVVMAAGFITQCFGGSLRARLACGAALLAMFAAAATLRGVPTSHETEAGLSVALVQGAIPQQMKWELSQREHAFKLYSELSAPHWQSDVVIWPETAIPAFADEVPEMITSLAHTARAARTTLLVGMPTGEPWSGGRYYNSVVALGSEPGRYDKRHLVPFGEFFPFKAALENLSRLLSIPMSDFSEGDIRQATLHAAGHAVGVSICYEDVYAREVRRALPQAGFLVNVSNNAWFGDTIAPHQHLQIARMRALEAGRYLLRATNTGITAIIDERGRVTARAPQFQPTALTGSFAARGGATPYVRLGDWPLFAVLVTIVLAVTLDGRRRAACR
ncbi:MAG: apolipoprotein N-acyltransferase [Proteobacteria bacterium]|nr:apolipoprotein N-acyltransferase [Pseudomonadota bacterium]